MTPDPTEAAEPRRRWAQFSTLAWERIEPIRTAIDQLPFVTGLESGTLDRQRFRYYLGQDARYLFSYGRVLAAAAAQASSADDVLFWATAARTTFVVERELHAAHVDLDATAASPTCLGYSAYLQSLAGEGSYPVLTAGVLPCFWIYQDVGERLLQRVGTGLDTHPYRDWISAYADPDFAEATTGAIGIVDRLASRAGDAVQDRMMAAFVTASRYEWMFWDAAWRMEDWPI